jgi:hypothetical protein
MKKFHSSNNNIYINTNTTNPDGLKSSSFSSKAELHSFGEEGAVKMTQEQYTKLCRKYGGRNTDKKINDLALYLLSTGKKYKSHYAVVLNWTRRALEDKKMTVTWEDFRREDFETQEDYRKTISKYN